MIIPTNENIYPIGRRLLVEAFKQTAETTEGLVVSEGEGYATSVLGVVIRAGDDCVFKEGDVLMWRRYSLDNIKVYTADGEKEYSLLEESEVIAQVREQVEPQTDEYAQIKERIKQNQDATKRGSEIQSEGEEVESPGREGSEG